MGIEPEHQTTQSLANEGRSAYRPPSNWSQTESSSTEPDETSIPVQPFAPQSFDREKLIRTMRFAIGHNLNLANTRQRNRRWLVFERFPNEDSARAYLEKLFWPNGPVCPRCQSGEHVGSGTNPYRCKACDRQFTVRSVSIFERSHIPLHRWLWAIVLLASARRKVSSVMLANLIGVSQPAAHGMIRKLKDIWIPFVSDNLAYLERDFDFAEFPITSLNCWPFFSHVERTLPKLSKAERAEYKAKHPARLAETFGVEIDDPIVSDFISYYVDDRSPEEKAFEKAVEKSHKSVERAKRRAWMQKQRSKYVKRFVKYLATWKKNHEIHQDHPRQYQLPGKPTRRDCPACRFGDAEYRHWQSIAVHLDPLTHEELWNWIEDLNREAERARQAPYEDQTTKEASYLPKFLEGRLSADPYDRDERFIEKWRAIRDDVKRRYIRIAILWERQMQERKRIWEQERERIREQEREHARQSGAEVVL
jgi:transposase-like protein